MSHWKLSSDKRYIIVQLSDSTESVIAAVENRRACDQLLRFAQAGEDTEALVDKLVADIARNSFETVFKVKVVP